MALLFPAGYQFLDSNADPLAAGTVRFYINETTTDKAIYSDNALTVSASNPYTLDSSGRLAVNLYGSGDYTVLVKDSAGSTIFTRDGVFGWGGSGAAQILATSGDTGDQSTAIQEYLTSYRDVYVPDGVFRYATTLEVPANTRVWGPGKLHYTGSGNAVKLMGDNIRLSGFVVYSDNAATYVSGHRGIFGQLTTFSPLAVSYFDNVRIEGVEIYGFGDTGIRIDWINDSSVCDNYIHDCSYAGILLTSSIDCHVDRNRIDDITPGDGDATGYGISLSRNSSATISGVPNTPISTTNAPVPYNSTVRGNVISDIPDYVAIDIHSGNQIVIAGNTTKNCQIGVNFEHGTYGAEVAGVSTITVTGNTFEGTATRSPAILIDAQSGGGEIAYGITITGNSFLGHGLSVANVYEGANGGVIYARDIDGLVVSGNTFDTSYGRCVSLDQGVVNCSIKGNSVTRLQSENSTQTAFESISVTARGLIDGNVMHGTAGYLFESVSPNSTYGLWLGDNLVTGGASLSDTTSLALAKKVKILGSAAYNPASLNDGQRAETDITVNGAILTDYARASFSLDTQGIILDAQVTAANNVTVTFHNETTGTIDLASGTINVVVVRDTV